MTVAGLVGASLLVAGCTPEHGIGRSTLPAQRQENPDEDLVTRALRAETVLLDRVRRTGRRHQGLRGDLAEAVHVHQAHVETADRDGAGARRRPTKELPVPHTPVGALAALVQAEQTLQKAHVASAMSADSGAFARVLAGMAAASAQQAVVIGALLSGLSQGGPGA